MEIEFERGREGGWSELTMGLKARTKLEIVSADSEQVRIALASQAGHGEMGLGVGLSPEQARSVGEELIRLAREIEDDAAE